jgi:hypothetical protein
MALVSESDTDIVQAEHCTVPSRVGVDVDWKRSCGTPRVCLCACLHAFHPSLPIAHACSTCSYYMPPQSIGTIGRTSRQGAYTRHFPRDLQTRQGDG